MKVETIKAIFTNALFVLGVVLLIVGFSRGVLTVTRLVVFDKYPLDYYAETRCEFAPKPVDRTLEADVTNPNCLSGLEYERKVKLTEDIVSSITMLIAGAVLTFSFKRFIIK